MNFQTDFKKQNKGRNIKIKSLALACIATFSLCNCASCSVDSQAMARSQSIETSARQDSNKTFFDESGAITKVAANKKLIFDKEMGVPVLLFHKFVDSPEDIKYPDTEITLDYFKNVLEYLKTNEYSTISYKQLYSYIKNGAPIPKNSVVLSIDDGFYADGAIELLKEYNMHADLAIVGERDEKGIITDPNDYYSWEQIANLAKDKDGDIIDVIDHTPQHLDLEKISVKPQELKQTLKSSMNIFKQELGSSSDVLVYPYGTYNDEVEQVAAQVGYKMGVTTDEGLNYYGENPFEIKRYLVNQNISIEDMFRQINSDSIDRDNDENNTDDNIDNSTDNDIDTNTNNNIDDDIDNNTNSNIDNNTNNDIDNNTDNTIDNNTNKNNDNNNDDTLVVDKTIGVPVLLFHKFMNSPSDIKYPDTEITLDYFKNVLEYLKTNEYSTISFKQLYSYIKDGTPIPKKSIVLSIDDGFCIDGAINLLKEYNMHADLAIVGKRDEEGIYTDPNGYYSWEQIIELAKDKDGDVIDIIDHTPDHSDLGELSKNPDKVKQLLQSSLNTFKQELGSSSDILVYPYGTYNSQVEQIAAQTGYKMGITVDEGLNYYGENPFEVKRYLVNQSVSIESLFNKINSDKPQK